MSPLLATWMILTIGDRLATVSTKDRSRRATSHVTWSATKTWTTTARGVRIRTMATSGPDVSASRLGPLSQRSLGVDCSLGLDMG